MKSYKFTGIIIIALLAISIITNPTYTKFKTFSQEIPIRGVYINTKQISNWFIFSIHVKEVAYTWNSGDEDLIGYIEKTKYVGLLSNFFILSKEIDQSQTKKAIKN